MKYLFVLVGLLLVPLQAHAGLFDFIVTVVAIYFLGPAGAGLMTAGGVALAIGMAAYGYYQQDQLALQKDKAERDAVDAYNDRLKDRTVTSISTEAPFVYVYGRARVGSAIVAVLSSGARDEYQHLICIHAAHECDAFEEIYIAKKALGTLDGNGFALSSPDYSKTTTTNYWDQSFASSFTLSYAPDSGSVRVFSKSSDQGESPIAFTLVGSVVTVTEAFPWFVIARYTNSVVSSTVRVKKHLGVPGEAADATLIAECPALWTAASKLSGFCYTYVRLDLNQQEFQGGIPGIEVLLRGKKLYDPRTTTTVWSSNNALVLYDYLRSDFCNVPMADIPTADVIIAADVCDTGSLYTCNGTVTSGLNPGAAINQICQSMMGGINSTTWEMWAGKYIAPTLTLEQTDIVGDIAITPGASDADIYNGVTGNFISPENDYAATDFKPYQNAAYRAADGRDLFQNIEFPFTDTAQRCHNLARIFIEDQRNSFTVRAVFSLKAWDTKIGQRINLNSIFFGFSVKVFRIVGKIYSGGGTVELLLKEDAPSIWDLADTVVLDSTLNTNLPNPFYISPPGAPTVSEELYQTTGSSGVKSRAIIEWAEIPSIRVSSYEVAYRAQSMFYWETLPPVSGLLATIDDIAPGVYEFRVAGKNDYFAATSLYSPVTTKTILGLYAAPGNVTGFSVTKSAGVALAAWSLTTDLDVRLGGRVVIRFSTFTSGALWVDGFVLDEFNGDATSGLLPLVTGTYMAKFKDSTGNYSATMASFVATEGMVTGFTTVGTSTQAPTFPGAKTNAAVVDGALRLDSVSTIAGMATLISTWSKISSLGGISGSGNYDFDAVMDLTTVATRRFESDITALSFDTGDLIGFRGLVSEWPSVAGTAIDDSDLTLFAATTNDDPAGSPVWSAWTPYFVGDFTCRAIKHKLALTSGAPTHNISVSQLTVHAKVPV